MDNTSRQGTNYNTLELGDENRKPVELKVYKRRVWMLFLFSFMSMLCGMLFTQYTSMANVNICFYHVSQESVNWTSNIFYVVYVVLVFPVSLLINHIDLRWTVVCASAFNTIACIVQISTLKPDSFPYTLLSSFFGSLSNVFVLGIPPFLAAKWFPSNELSRACSFGVFGNQLGVALGFVFSSQMVSSDCTRKHLIETGKRNVAYVLTAVNAVVLILIILTFQNAPKLPPSLSQATKKNAKQEPFKEIILKLFKNVNFDMIFVMYGLMVGSYFALSTTLNGLIIGFFPGTEVSIGYMGMNFIIAGLVGSIIAGYFLDTTKKFKETALFLNVASLVTFILFSSLLMVDKLWVQFVSITIYGFFLTSFLPVGFEYGLEMTYPLSESVCACLLNASTMMFGLIITEIAFRVLDNLGTVYFAAVFVVILTLCSVITSFISKDYKRCKQNEDPKATATKL